MRSRFALAVGIVSLVVSHPAVRAEDKPKAEPAKPVAIDLSTPKKAAHTFAKGIEQNDQKAVRAAASGTDEDFALFEMLSGIVASGNELQQAAIEKFGEEEGKKLGQQQQESIAAKVESAEEKIDGDTATLSDGSNDPLKLKKSGSDWRVDLSNMPNREEMSKAKPIMTAIGKMMKEVTADIKAGKFKTADEAQQAMTMKMIGALGGGGGIPDEPPADAAPADPKKDDAPAK